ncbi:hypothetical protein [Rhodoplanes elegans]|uniref:hypothetical protein n=1 Tax=Rhodoplanes elegans TaxID=29408 RepID=UPI0019140FC0|nr:hypothetical protein [Rhodoplanes elegans]
MQSIAVSAARAPTSAHARAGEGFADVVIPGRAEGANPESSGKLGILGWIPGSALCAAPE